MLLRGGRDLPDGFLVEADHVSCWRSRNLAVISGACRADRLHEFTSVGNHCGYSRGHAVHHDVDEAGPAPTTPAGRPPRAAHLAGRVVEGSVTVPRC